MCKTWLWTLMGMIGLAAVSYALFLWLSPPTLPEGFLYGNGRIEATEVTVSAEVGGRVLESALVEGRTVRANDLLVRFDDTDFKTRLKQAEANAVAVQRIQAQIEQQLDTWRRHVLTLQADVSRYKNLRAAGTISAQAPDRAQNQYQEARGQVGALEAQLAQMQANLAVTQHEVELLQSQLAKTTIRAPSAGTILTKVIETGELAVPGRTIAVLADGHAAKRRQPQLE